MANRRQFSSPFEAGRIFQSTPKLIVQVHGWHGDRSVVLDRRELRPSSADGEGTGEILDRFYERCRSHLQGELRPKLAPSAYDLRSSGQSIKDSASLERLLDSDDAGESRYFCLLPRPEGPITATPPLGTSGSHGRRREREAVSTREECEVESPR